MHTLDTHRFESDQRSVKATITREEVVELALYWHCQKHPSSQPFPYLQYILHGVFAPKDFALVDHFAAEMFSSLAIAPTKKRPAQILPVYELKITLRGRNPAIWRR